MNQSRTPATQGYSYTKEHYSTQQCQNFNLIWYFPLVYASQQHEQFLPDGNRAGFLVGDGAGVGKGRTIAGIIN